MKIIEESIALNQLGTVKIILEEPDDFWLAYNLIRPGDVIAADTSRKVQNPATGKASSRVRINLEIRITAVDYEKDSSILRVSGKTLTANEHVSAGAFHTLEIEKNKQFDLGKKNWDSETIDALRDACDKAADADLAVILFKEGSAQLYLVGRSVTNLCARIETATNHKSLGSQKFFESVFKAFTKHIDFSIVKCVIIGSNGSLKDEFRRYLLTESQKSKMKAVQENKSRIVVLNTGENNSLKAILNDTTALSMIKDTKASIEIRAFKEFSDALSSNSGRACYGPKSIEIAQEMNAIDTLLITDDLYKNEEISTRKKYIELVKSVKEAGGKAYVFSPTNVSGEQLAVLTGIAAILRFPVPDIDELQL